MQNDYRPRLAFVCADMGVPVFGNKGCSIHIQEVLRQFQRQGFVIDLFAVRIGGDCPVDLTEVRLHHYPVEKSNDHVAREKSAITAARQIQHALHDCGPFDLVYERYSLWSQAACGYGKQASVRSILEVNAPLIDEQKQHRCLNDESIARNIERHVFTQCDSVVAVSQGVADYVSLVANKNPMSCNRHHKRIHVISNGVDIDRFKPRDTKSLPCCTSNSYPNDKPGANDSPLKIGFTGTLKPWHGLETLLSAFRLFHQRFPNSELVMIGDGPMRSSLENFFGPADAAVSQAIQWKGMVPSAEIPAMLQQLDIAVAPYPALDDFYFSPLKVFEYMAAGLPVVASRIGQLNDILDHEHNGLLVKPGDPLTLSQALNQMANSAELRHRLGRNARAKAVREFSWRSVVQRTLDSVGWNEQRQPEIASSMARGK